jgi:hypothetical protein
VIKGTGEFWKMFIKETKVVEPKIENLNMKKGNKVVGTGWTHMQEEHSWEPREEWRSMIHQGINMSG